MSYNDQNRYYEQQGQPQQGQAQQPDQAQPGYDPQQEYAADSYQNYGQQTQFDEYGQPIYAQEQYDPEAAAHYDPNSAEYYAQQGYDPEQMDYANGNAYYEQPRGMGQDPENFSDFSYGPPGTPGYDGYGNSGAGQYTPSQMSYGEPRSSGASTPIYGGEGFDSSAIAMALPNEPYPAWTADNQAPATIEQIEDAFIDLTNRFGFQRDSMRNMFDHFMTLLDSRASRMSPQQALLSLHADYIGGDTANYKKWYFAAQLDMDDEVGFRNMSLGKLSRKARNCLLYTSRCV